jgi:hypothetical protein
LARRPVPCDLRTGQSLFSNVVIPFASLFCQYLWLQPGQFMFAESLLRPVCREVSMHRADLPLQPVNRLTGINRPRASFLQNVAFRKFVMIGTGGTMKSGRLSLHPQMARHQLPCLPTLTLAATSAAKQTGRTGRLWSLPFIRNARLTRSVGTCCSNETPWPRLNLQPQEQGNLAFRSRDLARTLRAGSWQRPVVCPFRSSHVLFSLQAAQSLPTAC